ncbi:dTDP-4-dehydrorhamnose 3,5-epimerase [Legionella anisa]|uniref:dTDP-4-dehydrorhamnose 3,5-epimerase n=1 Tax=Legionella anisa TaxID=28082 RepID=A0AAX0WVF7_9GAMM|nr:dTDP-4-dehydrorhamnose 3,5-epimerase [Legionella anisa]AWN73967.1 dTDP-4-dehydrorhamnose 3,5-epimerase [Legionella anisa]KTC67236.1 dTDP-6-deoxy-D-glucose-3,5-epimerase RmlC [Legionella anisa]MBN5934094.1 dTDP-4-dehydrorhamnose 3,5-epimerase [Legionella anisa]MCW8426016.1 dTDP-4-dehydrorhamnose 3,5-epimerase [Legionella anisa]MCW8448550.1 dTDP-4-dehydrorhamnose 3,5-epimerase [Legionella anisa]
MNILDTKISEVKIIEPRVYGDERGFFYESFQATRYAALLGIHDTFVQDNLSRSCKGVLRGLHYQYQHAQGKLVSVLAGEVFDVAVDIRLGSPTFGLWVGVILSGENKRQLWIPKGFAHGFYVLSTTADFFYKCTDFYHPESELSIHYQDPELAIDWPLSDDVQLSAKDIQASPLNLIDRQFLPRFL